MIVTSPLATRLLDCFPAGSYALGALLRLLDVVETDEVDTAAVDCRLEPRLRINPGFVDTWAATPEKLLMLVLHELHHVLLGHTRLFPRVTPVDNLVFDAVINALLCRMFPQPEYTSFFTDFYDDARFPACLLRPPAGWRADQPAPIPPALRAPELRRAAEVYRALYSPAGVGYHELYDLLRDLLHDDLVAGIVLLGDHGDEEDGASSAGALEHRAPLLFEIVRSIVEQWPQPPDPIAGRSLADLLREALVRPQRSISNRAALARLLRRVAGRGVSRHGPRAWRDESVQTFTPLPAPDRRAAVLQALGATPLLYRRETPVRRIRRTGERVHVYLDVSGSIGNLKGPLYQAVLDCDDLVEPVIHLFSTQVADITLAQLRRGECHTTGGTDIACVAQHMREHDVRRAVVITDGFVGTPGGADRETLLAARLGVALTPGYSRRDDLEGLVDFWTELSLDGRDA